MDISLAPMPTERFGWWREHTIGEYTSDLIKLGNEPSEARQAAERDVDAYFPQGSPLPGHHLLEIRHGDHGSVGYLWIGPSATGTSEDWWVWDVYVDEESRGKGYARAALQLGEDFAVEHGAMRIGLSVFGFNTGAKALYDSLGYTTTSIKMSKELSPRSE
jgi:ribosomal protein S18 acetylase RimI-like enzyme